MISEQTKKPNQFLLRLIISARSKEEVNGEGLNTTSEEQETWYRWNNSLNISNFHVFRQVKFSTRTVGIQMVWLVTRRTLSRLHSQAKLKSFLRRLKDKFCLSAETSLHSNLDQMNSSRGIVLSSTLFRGATCCWRNVLQIGTTGKWWKLYCS